MSRPSEPWWRKLWSPTIGKVTIPFLAMVLTLLLAEIQGRAGLMLTVLGFSASYIVFTLTVYLVHRYYLDPANEVLAAIERKVDAALAELSAERTGWMVDNARLESIELDNSVEEVWIVSKDIAGDVNGGYFIEAVKKNLRRGVSYVYFLPDDSRSRGQVMALRSLHNEDAKIVVKYLREDFFFLVKDFDFVIYNPRKDSVEGHRSGYMGLPVEARYGRWQVQVTDSLIETLVGHLNDYVSDR